MEIAELYCGRPRDDTIGGKIPGLSEATINRFLILALVSMFLSFGAQSGYLKTPFQQSIQTCEEAEVIQTLLGDVLSDEMPRQKRDWVSPLHALGGLNSHGRTLLHHLVLLRVSRGYH